MNKSQEDNTVAVIQRAVRNHKIRVTRTSVREALKTHPHYPSLLSICEVLNEWKVENFPLRLNENEILELKPPYIVHFSERGGQIAFVSEKDDTKIAFFESYKRKNSLEKERFIERCSGAVILLNPSHESGEKGFKRKREDELLYKAVFPLIILSVLLLTSLYVSDILLPDRPVNVRLQTVTLILTRSLGIILSLLLVLHEFDLHNAFTDKLCHLTKATSCNTVLHDRAARIFSWFGWADFGFIYFTGGLFLLPQLTRLNDYSWLSLLAALALPYPIFSVFYQGAVLKRWCPLCLGVQLILIIEFVILFPGLSHLRISYESVRVFTGTYLFTFVLYVLTNFFYREKKSGELFKIKYETLKFNPAVVRALFYNQKHFNIPLTEHSLTLGNENSGLLLTAFLSLHCSHCARAFQTIKELNKSDGGILINIVLVIQDKNLLNALYHLNLTGKKDKTIELLDRWYNANPYSRQSFSEEYCIPDAEDISDEISNENIKLFKECGVVGTPTFFLNGFRLPGQYTPDDIRYLSKYINKKELEIQQ